MCISIYISSNPIHHSTYLSSHYCTSVKLFCTFVDLISFSRATLGCVCVLELRMHDSINYSFKSSYGEPQISAKAHCHVKANAVPAAGSANANSLKENCVCVFVYVSSSEFVLRNRKEKRRRGSAKRKRKM